MASTGEPPGGRPLPAAALALTAGGGLLVLIFLGSRGLKDFDSALIGYAVGTVFAVAAIVYRYTLWLTRPPTWRYFRAGWLTFLSWRNFRRYSWLVPRAWWTDIFAQTFILRRSLVRWLMHMAIFWGVLLSCAITFPLTFGWLRFTLASPHIYELWFFGIPLLQFPLDSVFSVLIFHGLDFTAILLLAGLIVALGRRTLDAGLLATQRFGFDLLPLVLLLAVTLTGLALTASTHFWQARFYWFVSLTHQTAVVAWLISLPFGKFFHIVQRPATIGVTLYQTVDQADVGPAAAAARCIGCGAALPSPQFAGDLTATLSDLGQHYDLGRGALLQDYCPTCKRRLRGVAYYAVLGNRFL